MKKIKWIIKQLFPLSYNSEYSSGNKSYSSVWRMWFGHVFCHVKEEIKEAC